MFTLFLILHSHYRLPNIATESYTCTKLLFGYWYWIVAIYFFSSYLKLWPRIIIKKFSILKLLFFSSFSRSTSEVYAVHIIGSIFVQVHPVRRLQFFFLSKTTLLNILWHFPEIVGHVYIGHA